MRAVIVFAFWVVVWLGSSAAVAVITPAFLPWDMALGLTLVYTLVGTLYLLPFERVLRQEAARRDA